MKAFLFILISFNCLSQTVKLSVYETCWAVFHPFAAFKLVRINTQISPIYKTLDVQQQLDHFVNGGKADAFRHTFFMAAFAQKIKVKKLRKLGFAHEKSNYRGFLKSRDEDGEIADSLGTEMDLYNNELGFKIGVENKKIPLNELKKMVIIEIQKGNAIIMKRTIRGNYLTCDDDIIDLKKYSKKWGIPKCPVRSDYRYND